jgi:outer membrane biosynthesis protein TonB
MKILRYSIILSLVYAINSFSMNIHFSMNIETEQLPKNRLELHNLQNLRHFTALALIQEQKKLEAIHEELHNALMRNDTRRFKIILSTAFKNNIVGLHEYIAQGAVHKRNIVYHNEFISKNHSPYSQDASQNSNDDKENKHIKQDPLLCVAAGNASKEAVEILLHAGADPDIMDECHKKPIYYAIESSNFDNAELLAQAMPNLTTLINKNRTILSYLCDTSYFEDGVDEHIVHDIITIANTILEIMRTKHNTQEIQDEINKTFKYVCDDEIRTYLRNYLTSLSCEEQSVLPKTITKKVDTKQAQKPNHQNSPEEKINSEKTKNRFSKKERREFQIQQKINEIERQKALEEHLKAKQNVLITSAPINQNSQTITEIEETYQEAENKSILASLSAGALIESKIRGESAYTNSLRQPLKEQPKTSNGLKNTPYFHSPLAPKIRGESAYANSLRQPLKKRPTRGNGRNTNNKIPRDLTVCRATDQMQSLCIANENLLTQCNETQQTPEKPKSKAALDKEAYENGMAYIRKEIYNSLYWQDVADRFIADLKKCWIESSKMMCPHAQPEKRLPTPHR